MIALLFALTLPPITCVAQNPPAPAEQTPEVIDRRPNTAREILKEYEIHDLLPAVPPSMEDPRGWKGSKEENLIVRKPTIDFLSAVITREVQPPVSSKQWTLHLTPNGTMVLRATASQHEWLARFLDRNRSPEKLILIESQWIEGPKGGFERMGLAADASSMVIEAKDRDRLLAACKEMAQCSELMSPRLIIEPLANGTLYTGETLAYVKNYTLETVQPGDAKIAVPEIARIEEGLQMQAKAVLLDSDRIALEIESSSTVVHRPIATKSVHLATDVPSDLKIALPDVDRRAVQVSCTLSPEAAVAFRAPVAGNDSREFLVLLSAKTVRSSEVQKLPDETQQPR